jgi:hypothetical protein
MKKQQVQVMVFAVDNHSLLTFHKGKTLSHFEDKAFQFAQNGLFQIVFGISFRQIEHIQKVRVFENVERDFRLRRGNLQIGNLGTLVFLSLNGLAKFAFPPVPFCRLVGVEKTRFSFFYRYKFPEMRLTQLSRHWRDNFQVGKFFGKLHHSAQFFCLKIFSILFYQLLRHRRNNLLTVIRTFILQNILVDTFANIPKEHCHHAVRLNNNKIAALLNKPGQIGEQRLPDGFFIGNFFCHHFFRLKITTAKVQYNFCKF